MTDQEPEHLDVYEPVYRFVRNVPRGSVVTYGQVAGCVHGISVTARQVGTAMRYAPPDAPWHRVVGAGGAIRTAGRSPELAAEQRRLLAEEGVQFAAGSPSRVDMARSQWLPEESTK